MKRTLAVVCFVTLAAACAARPSRLRVYPLVEDPTSTTVWGLVFREPTDRVQLLTPLFDPQEPTGGVALDDNEKYIFSSNAQGVYMCTRLSDHQTIWRRIAPDPLTMPPYFITKESVRAPHDLVVEATQNGRIFAVKAETGEEAWHYDLGGEIWTAPALAEGRLLVLNTRNQLVALDALTGKWLWQYSRDFPVNLTIAGHSGITVQGGHAFVGFSDGFVVSVNLEDGLLAWSRPLTLAGQGFADADATPVLSGGRLFAASVHDGVAALHPGTGEVLWQARIANVTRIAAAHGHVYAASTSGKVLALDAESGKTVWAFSFPPAVVTRPVVYRGYVTVGSRPHGLFVLDAQKGQLVQRFYPGGGIASELVHDRAALAFMSEGSMVYYMRYGERPGVVLGPKRRFQGL